MGPSRQEPQGCLGPGWLWAMWRFSWPSLDAWTRQRLHKRTSGLGPKVGRGGGRSKGRGRGISIQLIEAIAGSPLLGFVKWLLRHNIDPMQSGPTFN